MTLIAAPKKFRHSVAHRDRQCTFLAFGLVAGALCLRLFALPSRKTSKPLPTFQSLQVTLPQDRSRLPTQFLPINPTGTMASDIMYMEHVPEKSAIVVTLNPDARCRTPFLRGRLSGPALVLLEWSTTSHGEHVGQYHVPVSGTYFVEIIVITCQDFSQSLDFDFQSTCVEDPQNHRLTRSNVKIEITASSLRNSHSHQPTMGYWMHQADERAANNDYEAMYTRFQPRGCLRLNDPTHEHFHRPPKHCIDPTNWNRFEPYNHFQYYGNTNIPNSATEIQAPQPITICLVGGSHSRTLKASMQIYHNFSMANNNLQVEWVDARFPRNVNNQTILQDIAGKCNKIIVAVGQWPASFSGGKPTLFSAFQLEMKKLLGRLQAHLPAATDLWARSIHENPLTERVAAYCPPKDWRSPTVLQGYNTIIRQIVESSPKARFVDTSFIVSPLWDSSTDWGHVCPQASHVEALYLIAVVMRMVEPNT